MRPCAALKVATVILATGSYIGEGFDDAHLDTLFLAMPVSWKAPITLQPATRGDVDNRSRTAAVVE